MRTEQAALHDVRVRRAISLAFDRQALLDATAEAWAFSILLLPRPFKECPLPVDQLGEGAQYYKHDPARAKKLLAEAGYPNGFQATVSYATYCSTVMVTRCSSCSSISRTSHRRPKANRRVRRLHVTRSTKTSPCLRAADFRPSTDNFLFGMHMPGELKPESRHTRVLCDC